MELNKHSKTITQDPSQPGSQAQLYATGLTEADMSKAQVGIVSTGFEGNPCNMHLNILAHQVKKGVKEADLVGLIFHTIGVSDGISNGTVGMKYSLVSRDIIADSIETVVNAQFYDAVVPVVGCDKNMPGAIMALGRLNRPGLMVYGGSVKPGKWKGEDLNIVSAFEAYGQKLGNNISDEDFKGIIKNAIPGPGACGGMYTANTLASAIEAMGMSLPSSSSNPAESEDKKQETYRVGQAVRHLLTEDIRPSDIMTKEAFENAIRLVMITGGSTNAVLHLIAMAKSVDVPIGLDDFQRLSDTTPFLADLKPSGKYLMEDLHNVGGIPGVMKVLLKEGYLHGDCMTVTGKTLAQNIEEGPSLKAKQDVIHSFGDPIKKSGHLQILYGNLAPTGAVAKITGKEGEYFEGPARCYDDEFAAIKGIGEEVQKGEVIVIRYSGPKGGPGMPEMLKPTGAVMGAGLGKDVALITDGRFSGGSHGFVVGHITPEAQEGGPLGLVKDGDIIAIDAVNNKLELKISDEEMEKRKKEWVQPPYKATKGILKKYINQVKSASEGCVTDE
ncbi:MULTISPECIES: dihydroxy-acid dehydratase [Reichenbachiella]|uniref:Dihydroxy-acid dehydratase n=1 Tax=Reichenbachiella agariperforans TaxID=156994 RepID=A0A1M6R483_REIAG|nr:MULTISPECIES: dihydroxy-acid dehydratase [Reichenbachiella]RJE70674.1 dihydroxy-acid dehydratase [Reichenbachiella sp. MSK19-1]SHK27289.1 dihydroxy-acid dehydratase [Reichenbachiella agariperforans]